MNDFHCGHVIAEAKGGETVIENLRPICKKCNLSMGTDNLNDFRKRYGFDRGSAGAPSPSLSPSPSLTPAPAPAPAPAVAAPIAELEEVFWSPGMFSRGGVIRMPKYIKWQKGTNSIQMGQELTQYGYVYNRGVYERI